MFDKIKASDGNEYTKDAVFTDSAGDRVGVIGQDTTPNLSASEMQYSVEAVVREVVIPAHNSLVDALNALTAASSMGAEDISGAASTVQEELGKRILTGNVKYIRLNSDMGSHRFFRPHHHSAGWHSSATAQPPEIRQWHSNR